MEKELLMMAIIQHHSQSPITDLYTRNIAANKFFRPNLGHMTIANNLGFAGGSFLKYSNCVFSTTFLGNTQYCISNQDRKNLDQISALLPKAPARNM